MLGGYVALGGVAAYEEVGATVAAAELSPWASVDVIVSLGIENLCHSCEPASQVPRKPKIVPPTINT